MEKLITSDRVMKRRLKPAFQNGYQLDAWVICFLLPVFMFVLPTKLYACERPALATTWINAEPELNQLSRLKIDYNCGEKPIKAYDPLSASLWIVRGYMQCARTECIWGRAKGETQPNGEMWVTFSAFATVRKLKLNQESGLLKVEVETIYRDERRAPLKQSYYLHPEQ